RVDRAGMARGRDRAHPGGDLRVGADGARGLARLNPGPAHGAQSDDGAGYGTFDSGVATTYVIDPHGTTVTSMCGRASTQGAAAPHIDVLWGPAGSGPGQQGGSASSGGGAGGMIRRARRSGGVGGGTPAPSPWVCWCVRQAWSRARVVCGVSRSVCSRVRARIVAPMVQVVSSGPAG